MTDFTYTHDLPVDSSLVEGVFYNANDWTLVLDLNDSLYRYDNVALETAKAIAYADSPGGYYNTIFRKSHGSAEYLGEYDDLSWTLVDHTETPVENAYNPVSVDTLDTLVGNDWSTGPVSNQWVANPNKERYGDDQPMFVDAGATKEYSLGQVAQSSVIAQNADVVLSVTPTTEYSLKTPEAPTPVPSDDVTVTSTVFFTLDSGPRVYEFSSNQTDLQDALDEVHEYVSRLGAKGVATKVVFDFE